MEKQNNRSLERKKSSFGQSFNLNTEQSIDCLILCAPSDIGVRRNFGRNGARFSPKAIINSLKKFSLNKSHPLPTNVKLVNVSNQMDETLDFHKAQDASSERIQSEILPKIPTVHIGGGHDHAYPLLKALDKKYKSIYTINIDAHCDSRQEDLRHSGTPFRDFDNLKPENFELLQLGIQYHANTDSTQEQLANGSMSIIGIKELTKLTTNFTNYDKLDLKPKNIKLNDNSCIYISLDADAITGDHMKSVSAVNPNGVPLNFVEVIIDKVKELECNNIVFGIYEYNPILDDLSQLGSRSLSYLIHHFLKQD